MSHSNVIIVGGGCAGISVASRINNLNDTKVKTTNLVEMAAAFANIFDEKNNKKSYNSLAKNIEDSKNLLKEDKSNEIF